MQLPNNTTPVAIGAVIGAIAISIVSLANGWVVTSSKMNTEMDKMNVSVQASICAARAEAHIAGLNIAPELEGYQASAREKREELANTYASPLQGETDRNTNVVNACAGLLNKSHS